MVFINSGFHLTEFKLYQADGHDNFLMRSSALQCTYYRANGPVGAYIQSSVLLPIGYSTKLVGEGAYSDNNFDGEFRAGLEIITGPAMNLTWQDLSFLIGAGLHLNYFTFHMSNAYSIGLAATGLVHYNFWKNLKINVGITLAIDNLGALNHEDFIDKYYLSTTAVFTMGIGFSFDPLERSPEDGNAETEPPAESTAESLE